MGETAGNGRHPGGGVRGHGGSDGDAADTKGHTTLAGGPGVSVAALTPGVPTGSQARRRMLFVTGTRADFGKLKPLVCQVAAQQEFEYRIFATGMHLLSRYGS